MNLLNRIGIKICTYILLAIFSVTPIIEVFHNHHPAYTKISKTSYDAHEKHQIIYAKCTVCDFVYKFSKSFHEFNCYELTIFASIVCLNSNIVTVTTNSGYTHLSGNKGPPSIS